MYNNLLSFNDFLLFFRGLNNILAKVEQFSTTTKRSSFFLNNLIIPLDTHVFRISKQLGLTNRKQANMLSAIQITEELKITFPEESLLGDYALFDYGVKHQEKTK